MPTTSDRVEHLQPSKLMFSERPVVANHRTSECLYPQRDPNTACGYAHRDATEETHDA